MHAEAPWVAEALVELAAKKRARQAKRTAAQKAEMAAREQKLAAEAAERGAAERLAAEEEEVVVSKEEIIAIESVGDRRTKTLLVSVTLPPDGAIIIITVLLRATIILNLIIPAAGWAFPRRPAPARMARRPILAPAAPLPPRAKGAAASIAGARAVHGRVVM